MGWLRIVLEYIDVLVWPAITAAVIILFKSELRVLIKRLARVKFPGGTEVVLGDPPAEAIQAKKNEELREYEAADNSDEERDFESGTVQVHPALDQARLDHFTDLVLKQLQVEFKKKPRREVSFNSRPDLLFDGVVTLNDMYIFVEVKIASRYRDISQTVNQVFAKFDRMMAEGEGEDIRGILVYVVESTPEQIAKYEVQANALAWQHRPRKDIRVYSANVLLASSVGR